MATRTKMKAKRIGANRQRHIKEQRSGRPRVSKEAVRTLVLVVAFAMFAGFVFLKYSTEIFVSASDAVRVGKRLYPNIRITDCSNAVQESLRQAFDSMMAADSFSFDRAGAVKAASMIPEIEKISVKKFRDRKNRELTTHVKVTERKPVALVHCGGISLVDKQGVRFAVVPGQYYDLPLLVVDAEAAGDTVDLDVFYRIRKACRLLGPAFFPQISQIDLSGGEAVNLVFKSGEAEYVVNPEDVEEKMVQIKKLREKLLEEGSEPARIDMRYHRLAVTSAK